MTNNIQDQLNEIREQISTAQSRKTRAELMREQAQERITRSHETLLKTYKVETVEDARKLLDRLDTNMKAKIEEARSALAEAADG